MCSKELKSEELKEMSLQSPECRALKIYIAGPDVFAPDAISLGRSMCDAVRNAGYIPLFPLDNEIDAASDADLSKQIFIGNIAMIQDCDIVLANLNFFRGFEPDSGTCWEVGYAFALGKKIVGYLGDARPMVDKICTENGWRVEDFGLPLNLMLCHGSFKIVQGGFFAALTSLESGGQNA
ncbi:MAG: nucleoside 2-deoxyribosyltransferase [Pseudobdellovibrionaceae bacterium]|jgi:nucleoside 2-deoxyribosyltransferase|nr:nucleoside 2-deoxyribosyltransferase [Pseudobdellovibrionaceae bacterium]